MGRQVLCIYAYREDGLDLDAVISSTYTVPPGSYEILPITMPRAAATAQAWGLNPAAMGYTSQIIAAKGVRYPSDEFFDIWIEET